MLFPTLHCFLPYAVHVTWLNYRMQLLSAKKIFKNEIPSPKYRVKSKILVNTIQLRTSYELANRTFVIVLALNINENKNCNIFRASAVVFGAIIKI